MARARHYPMRRFYLNRTEDVTGNTGPGRIAWGVLWESGAVSLEWMAKTGVNTFFTLQAMNDVHGHIGKTLVEWIDPDRECVYCLGTGTHDNYRCACLGPDLYTDQGWQE
jgi:hypothetical protein